MPMWNLNQSCALILRTTNPVPGSASAIMPSRHRYVQVVPLNIFAATRTNSQVLPARHLQLASRGPAVREPSDQVQECASEAADSNLTTTLNFSIRVTNFSSQSSAHAVGHRTSKLRRGQRWTAPRLTVMIHRKDYYGRNCNPHFWFRRG